MQQDIEIRIKPEEAANPEALTRAAARKLGIKTGSINDVRVVRRSVDARKKPVSLNMRVRVATGGDMQVAPVARPIDFHPVAPDAPEAIIVGAGPAGLFAALRCIERGIRPIVLERGKDVDRRRLDIAAISREGIINPESNYCFGEGGAGTFSDGKLYTRSLKRGKVEDILQILHQHGAKEDILIDAHAHIGSDRLPHVIKAIRETIIRCGGEMHFDCKVDRIVLGTRDKGQGTEKEPENSGIRVLGVKAGDREFRGPVILATGHSARDVYRFLKEQDIRLEAKGFAMGVRLEHPQKLIDQLQYHSSAGRGEYLPAAEYSYVTQVDGRGVYSFCMCPGGVVVPAESGPDQQVVNGMSASARAGRWANSGMVVEIHPEDFPEYAGYGELSMLHLQEDLERKFYEASGRTINAPAQRMKDFTEGKISQTLPPTSYAPGIHSADFNELLPPFISTRLAAGFREFGRRSNGFLTNEAILLGLESRTSSPVRIPRDPETLQHPDLPGLYPVGEGAGFAGGIVSAAIDGRRAADCLEVKVES